MATTPKRSRRKSCQSPSAGPTIKPAYKGEVEISHPASSGTAYTVIAGLVELMGEDKAFDYLKALHKNTTTYTRSGQAQAPNVAKGEVGVGITSMFNFEKWKADKYPVKTQAPCEGTSYEVGGIALVKGARNMDNAKKYYDWPMSPEGQVVGAQVGSYQVPANKTFKMDPRIPTSTTKPIKYDFEKYGKAAERRRLIDRWTKEGAPAALMRSARRRVPTDGGRRPSVSPGARAQRSCRRCAQSAAPPTCPLGHGGAHLRDVLDGRTVDGQQHQSPGCTPAAAAGPRASLDDQAFIQSRRAPLLRVQRAQRQTQLALAHGVIVARLLDRLVAGGSPRVAVSSSGLPWRQIDSLACWPLAAPGPPRRAGRPRRRWAGRPPGGSRRPPAGRPSRQGCPC